MTNHGPCRHNRFHQSADKLYQYADRWNLIKAPFSGPKRRHKSARYCLVWVLNNNIEFSLFAILISVTRKQRKGGPIPRSNLYSIYLFYYQLCVSHCSPHGWISKFKPGWFEFKPERFEFWNSPTGGCRRSAHGIEYRGQAPPNHPPPTNHTPSHDDDNNDSTIWSLDAHTQIIRCGMLRG